MNRPVLFSPPHLYDSRRWAGMRIGLFGGTFNPPHAGHVHACTIAMKYLGLDAVWWMVTPGNPLKSNLNLPDITARMDLCRNMIHDPRIVVTDIERHLGTFRTCDTIKALKSRYPHTDFIWFSGTEISYEFPRWYKWRELQSLIPFAFVGRPTKSGLVRQNSFRMSAKLRQTYPLHGTRPPLEKGRIYWIFAEKLMDISSTRIRGTSQKTSSTAPPAP